MKSTIQSFCQSMIVIAMPFIILAGCKKESSSEKINVDVSVDAASSAALSGEKSTIASALVLSAREGFGSATPGGTGQTVVHVSNLNSSGTGSLKDAMGSNRTIVFDVGGTINAFQWSGSGIHHLTIDGSTAPSPGITLNNAGAGGDALSFDDGSNNIIVSNIRVRNAENDGINVLNASHDIVFDHCSSANNGDGNLDITTGSYNITVEWSILGASVSGPMLIAYPGTKNNSIHHNLFNSSASGAGERNPFVHNAIDYQPNITSDLMADFTNNLVWKWTQFGSCADYGGTLQCRNNFYQSSSNPGNAIVVNRESTGGKIYASGNVSGNSGVNPNNVSNVSTPWAVATVTTQDACTAAAMVLAQAGPRPLDAIDQALINGVTTNCPTTNQVPVVNAGVDKTIALPVSSVTLTGTASDPDGTIASYLWTKVSGTGGTITTPTALTTIITGLTAGSYVYSLKVTDNQGATATDNITITVNAAATTNQVPVVNAGIDKTITLPVSLVTLTGTASDPDGTIASYLWTKVSGTGGIITTLAAATTTVTGLISGTYVFSLKVTDNQGATATDNITVIVNPAPINQVPIVNAGPGQTITLPVSSVTLSGSATDADGTIVSYLWTKVLGAGVTITSPNSASTTVSGLTAGSYVFNLRATDNGGATSDNTVTITVNAAQAAASGYGSLTYSEGYDLLSSVNTNQGIRNSVSFTNYKTGPGSFRSEVRAGDAGSSGMRSEMVYTGSAQNPAEGVLEYDVYYENWNSLDGGGHSIQWSPGTSGAGAILSLQNYGGKFDVVRAIGSTVTHQSGSLMNCASNTWYKMRWEYKWSTGNSGYIRFYINNVMYYSFTGKTADGSGQTLRVGQSRWPNSGNTMQVTSVSYYDNLKIYKR